MTDLFDKKFQKELEEHCGEPKKKSRRATIEKRPWDDHFVSEYSLWDRISQTIYAVMFVVFALNVVILLLYWIAPSLLLSVGAIKAMFH